MKRSDLEDTVISSSSSATEQIEVPLFSEDNEDTDLADVVQPKKKRREGKIWTFINKFENGKLAEEAVKVESSWSKLRKHQVEEGIKIFYRCNKVKRQGPQCAAQLYLLFDAVSDDVLMYRTGEHDHYSLPESQYGISIQVKEQINTLVDLHLKPKAIMHNLAKIEGITLPKMSQLRNYLYQQRRFKYGCPTISLGELEAWLLSHSIIPNDDHEVYVLDYEIFEQIEPPKFRFVISTKFLMNIAKDAKVVHADATYKLIWQGFPVSIVGSTNKNKKFYPFCLGVTTCEEKDDFKLLFGAIKKNVLTLFKHCMEPEILVCDASKAIQNAFIDIFGSEIIVRMCWAHTKKNIQARVEQIARKTIHNEILSDVDYMHICTSSEMFNLAAEAFIEKWQSENDFVKYFKDQWLILNKNWYLGVHFGSPATNNGLESFNRIIKDEYTLRERLPLSFFLNVADEMVSTWSSQHSSNKVFAESLTLSLKLWTDSYQWAKLPKKIILTDKDDKFKYYYIPGGKAEIIKEFANSPLNFDEYRTQFFNKWKVGLPLNNEWIHSKCNCPIFFKEYMCKHILGLAIRLKLTKPPPEAKNIPIGQKRKRGRPSKAKPALIIQ